ncbi:MAG TPA: DinB family protein [Holophagaceae bacterium]|nr:DinB family protein [Holophagaceae bacterium]
MLTATRSECARLADQLERGYRGGAWHGPSLGETLAGVEAPLAAWRPAPGFHCIADLVGHLAYWMRETSHRMGGGDSMAGPDWPSDAPLTAEAWRDRLADLEEAYRSLHATLGALDDSRLEDAVPGADPTIRGLLLGTLQHNAYHSAQMALLRKLAEARP